MPLAVTVDDAALRTWVAGVAAQTDVAAVEGEFSRKGVEVVVVEPVVGRHLEQDASGRGDRSRLAHRKRAARWTDWNCRPAPNRYGCPTRRWPLRKRRPKTLLDGDLTVKTGDGTLTIPAATVAKAVTIREKDDGFAVGIDSAGAACRHREGRRGHRDGRRRMPPSR